MKCFLVCLATVSLVTTGNLAVADTLAVGPGKKYPTIQKANAAAKPGDLILVSPLANGDPYYAAAIFVTQPRLTFRADRAEGQPRVKLSGKGFNYTGVGSVPRAIFQFNPAASGCTVEGFDIAGASNDSHNGAGVRIVQADNITIRDCDIHDNNMGIMSSGTGKLDSAVNQLIERCAIHHNGDTRDPGYNHNLYLAGTSVTVRFCDIHDSITGNNLKSRAHFTRVEYSWIHDSANRELDLVDGPETAEPNSDAVILGCVIAKAPDCEGNRAVIHFGQDVGGSRTGTLHLIHNTIITPFITPVITLSTPNVSANLVGNIIHDGGAKVNDQVLAKGPDLRRVTGRNNWLSAAFADSVADTGIDLRTSNVALGPVTVFANCEKRDYRIACPVEMLTHAGLPVAQLQIPRTPGSPECDPPLTWQYDPARGPQRRPASDAPDLGAFAFLP